MRYSASLTATCRIRALAALAVAATAIAAFGAGTADASPTCTIYWTGKTNTNWSTATNWSLIDGGGVGGPCAWSLGLRLHVHLPDQRNANHPLDRERHGCRY